MRYFSTFSGAEGIGMGFPEHWECIGFSEIHTGSSAILNYHWPNIKNYGDISAIDWSTVPDFDLLIGGSPCQDLSIAGKRAGLEGERSSLFFEYVRALREKQPAYFLWENVAGALSSNEGWDFAEVQAHLAESGYALWWQLLNAKYFGVPQKRTRIIVVGARNGRIPEVLFKQGDDSRDSEEEREEETASQSLTTRSGRQDPTAQTYIANPLTTRQNAPSSTQRREYENYVANSITTHSGGSQLEETLAQEGLSIRRFTPLESERIMTWPDGHTQYGRREDGSIFELSDAQRYFACGNGVATGMIREIAPYLFPDTP